MLWPPYSTGYDVDMPWRDLPKEDQDWIIYTDEPPFVPVHSWLAFSESKAAICPVCQGKRLKPEALIKSLVAGPRRPPRQMCDTQYVPRQRKRAAAVELAAGGGAATSSTGRFGAGLPFIESDDADALWW